MREGQIISNAIADSIEHGLLSTAAKLIVTFNLDEKFKLLSTKGVRSINKQYPNNQDDVLGLVRTLVESDCVFDRESLSIYAMLPFPVFKYLCENTSVLYGLHLLNQNQSFVIVSQLVAGYCNPTEVTKEYDKTIRFLVEKGMPMPTNAISFVSVGMLFPKAAVRKESIGLRSVTMIKLLLDLGCIELPDVSDFKYRLVEFAQYFCGDFDVNILVFLSDAYGLAVFDDVDLPCHLKFIDHLWSKAQYVELLIALDDMGVNIMSSKTLDAERERISDSSNGIGRFIDVYHPNSACFGQLSDDQKVSLVFSITKRLKTQPVRMLMQGVDISTIYERVGHFYRSMHSTSLVKMAVGCAARLEYSNLRLITAILSALPETIETSRQLERAIKSIVNRSSKNGLRLYYNVTAGDSEKSFPEKSLLSLIYVSNVLFEKGVDIKVDINDYTLKDLSQMQNRAKPYFAQFDVYVRNEVSTFINNHQLSA